MFKIVSDHIFSHISATNFIFSCQQAKLPFMVLKEFHLQLQKEMYI